MRDASPLRYPGGKWRLAGFVERLISLNFTSPPAYIEPYAGGASLALSLLFTGNVSEVFINDLDPAIYAFWHSILNNCDQFITLLSRTPITPSEWKRQKRIYAAGTSSGMLSLGFATFFLNRTNHSGILNGGMIGGKKQMGEWKVDARFNRTDLVRRIRRIATHKRRIHLYCHDAVKFLRMNLGRPQRLYYLDPPYYSAGRDLYMNAYHPGDHASVNASVMNLRYPWIVSYDDVPSIRRLYVSQRSRRVQLRHTARVAHEGEEVMFFSEGLRIPRCKCPAQSLREKPILSIRLGK